MLLALDQWRDAFHAIETAEEQLRRESERREEESSKLIGALMSQLRALVHLVIYQKSKHYRTGISNEDLRAAERHAGESYNAHYDAMKASQSDQAKEQLRKSARLLAIIFTLGGKDEYSKGVLEDTAAICESAPEALLMEEPREVTQQELVQSLDEEDKVIGDSSSRSDSTGDLARIVTMPRRMSGPDRLLAAIEENLSDKDLEAHLEHGDDLITVTDNNGFTALHLAAKKGRRRLVELLVHHGADVTLKNRFNETPLLIAIKAARCDIIEELAEHEGSIKVLFGRQWNCLHSAIRIPDTEVTATLLESTHGAKLVGWGDDTQMTALHKCADNSQPEHAAVILQYSTDAQVDQKDAGGQTALDICLSKGLTIPAQRIVDSILDRHSGDPLIQATTAQRKKLDVHKRRRAKNAASPKRGG